MRRLLFFLSIPVLMIGLLSAFSVPALADDDDPPGRVARLNYIQGSMSFQPGGATDWVQASPNRPLTTGDNLWADRNSRGELHIGSTAIRVGSETGITFLNLNDRTTQIQLAQGSMSVHVRRLEGGEAFEVDTPNLAFTLERPGEYRVNVDPDGGSTSVVVRQGEGDATGGGNEFHMDSGDQATFTGTETLTFHAGHAEGYDEFDEWCRSRDDREERSLSARYVSRDIDGYEDLDDYGEWRSVPDYGNVWFPAAVAPGWAPYRFGRWVWIAPWGWTWVEDEPWGFAPFHYGRWAVYDGAWCWVPGPVVVRPVYAPALVVFVGGPRFGVSLSFGGGGGVGWFPLGPREVYVPPYRTSVHYVQNVNVTNTTVNVTNVTNVYNNVTVNNVNNTTVNKITYMHQNNVNAVTVVNHDTFVNARPVAAAAVHVNAQQIQAAEVQRNVTAAPVQKSVVGAAPPAPVRPPQAVMLRQVVVKETPPPPRAAIGSTGPAPVIQQGRGQGSQGQQQMQGKPQPGSQGQQAPGRQQQAPASQPPQFPPRPQQGQAQQTQQPIPARTQPTPPSQQTQQPAGSRQSGFNAPEGAGYNPPPGRGPSQRQTVQPSAPPPQQNPNVKFAPPPKATEDTYHPHQFEKPQSAAPPAAPQNAAPPRNERPQERPPAPPQERSQPHGPEPNKQEPSRPNGGQEEKKQLH